MVSDNGWEMISKRPSSRFFTWAAVTLLLIGVLALSPAVLGYSVGVFAGVSVILALIIFGKWVVDAFRGRAKRTRGEIVATVIIAIIAFAFLYAPFVLTAD